MEAKHILIVDDEITIRTVLEKYLSKHYTVTAFDNGKEAMHWLQDGHMPDLVIVDVQMPEMDGEEFLGLVKASGYFRDIPVIMLSGLEGSEERIRFLKMGANDFIVKPFNPEELELKIQINLGTRS